MKIGLLWIGVLMMVRGTVLAGARPNVLFVLVDDLGYGDIGVFFQNDRAKSGVSAVHFTPELDRMAARGLQLRHHYSAAPVCAPARASLLTGQHQGNASIRDNQFDKALADQWTLPKVMRSAGYRTALVGKFGLQGSGRNAETWPAYPTKRGFQEFFGYVRHRDGHEHYPFEHPHFPKRKKPIELWWNEKEIGSDLRGCYTADLWTAWTKRWLVEHAAKHSDQPFFLMLSYDTPHATTQLAACPYPEGRGVKGGLQWLGKSGAMINTAKGQIDSYVHPDYADKNWKEIYKRYASSVRRIDNSVGDLLATLKELKMLENTLVVFTSDNGPSLESYLRQNLDPSFFESFGPMDGTKRDCWEGGIRVGALVHWPKAIRAGGSTNQPSQFHDWMPTFCELAGVATPAICDGVSLVPTLTGKGIQEAPTTYVEYSVGGTTPKYAAFSKSKRGRKRGQMQALIRWPYKAVRYDVRDTRQAFEVFNLEKDPAEENNLANQSGVPSQDQWETWCGRLRSPNSSAPRPYDSTPAAALKLASKPQPALLLSTTEAASPYLAKVTETQAARTTTSLPAQFGQAYLRGFIQIEKEGKYRFGSVDGLPTLVRINGALAFNNEDPATHSAPLLLAAGYHAIEISLRLDGRKHPHVITWQSDGIEEQGVPADQFFHHP